VPVNQLNTTDAALAALAAGRNRDPFAVLGPHVENGRLVIRAFYPAARSVELRLLSTNDARPMIRRGSSGVFEIDVQEVRLKPDSPYESVPDVAYEFPDYRLRVTFAGDHTIDVDDPYRYGRVLTDFDVHLLGEGTHLHAAAKLGAHRIWMGPTAGTHFAVWAPNADRVSVIGDFNAWDGRVHPMRAIVPGGFWEIFIPGLGEGEKYKFEIRTASGTILARGSASRCRSTKCTSARGRESPRRATAF
jgi:1,4-alpha-glucan branching enzyme